MVTVVVTITPGIAKELDKKDKVFVFAGFLKKGKRLESNRLFLVLVWQKTNVQVFFF